MNDIIEPIREASDDISQVLAVQSENTVLAK